MTAGQREQDEAAGGPKRRELRLSDGTVVMASVAVRRYARTPNLRGLKAPSDQQRLLLMLADKPDRTADDARIINAEKAAERKARDHELYQSAGLLILAGLVDTTTGKPTRDRGELLGALVSLAEAQVDDEKRAAWKRKGDALLAERARR